MLRQRRTASAKGKSFMKMRYFLGLMAASGLVLVSMDTTSAIEPGIRHNIPPAIRLAEPGPMVGGPGPGVLMPETIPAPPPGAVAPAVQVLFNMPQSMHVLYDMVGDNSFTSEPIVVPGRQTFGQGGIYRLKLTNIGGREGVELYPTLEIAPSTPRSAAYLAHSALPIQFTEEDFDQALSSNFVTKVIYLPDPEFQGDALAGIDTLVSTRLEPGLDPIIEADRRGAILAIIRLGNKDVEMTGDAVVGGGYMQGYPGMGGGMCGPDGMPLDPMQAPPNMVAGVSAPQYGMTYSGTPIGLPGPPHIPFGAPAGLQSHVMKNHTHMNIPGPVEQMKIHVRSQPGQSYPQPPSRMHYREQNIHNGYPSGRPPFEHASRSVPGDMYNAQGMAGAGGEYCPPGVIR
jgi:hypothetical protein